MASIEFEEAVSGRNKVAEKDCGEIGLAEESKPTAGKKRVIYGECCSILERPWQYVVIAGGGLTLLGAIFNWRWGTSPEGERPNGPGRFIYDLFGQGGYRVFMGILGVVIIACGIFFLFVVR